MATANSTPRSAGSSLSPSMAMTTVSKALPSREVLEERLEAVRLRIWQVEGTCGLASTAGWGESGGSAGFAHNIWTSMAGAANALDAVTGLLDPFVLLDTAEIDPATGKVMDAAMMPSDEGALATAEKLHELVEYLAQRSEHGKGSPVDKARGPLLEMIRYLESLKEDHAAPNDLGVINSELSRESQS